MRFQKEIRSKTIIHGEQALNVISLHILPLIML